jgi:type VI secretion system protein ImpK
MSAAAAPATPQRTTNIALAFQEVFTVVLRTRYGVQGWDSVKRMREATRQLISTAAQNVRALGYSDEATQMALYAIVGFLDESVQSSSDPLFADWARRPLQEEIFGDLLAGERFFRNVAALLNRPESHEVADVLEMHYLCLLLGFRGRYAFGDASEIHTILRRIREKLERIRGPLRLAPAIKPVAVPRPRAGDRWVRVLTILAVLMAVLCLGAYAGYSFLLLSPREVAKAGTREAGVPVPRYAENGRAGV